MVVFQRFIYDYRSLTRTLDEEEEDEMSSKIRTELSRLIGINPRQNPKLEGMSRYDHD